MAHSQKLRRILLKLSGEFLFEFNGQVEVNMYLLNVIKQMKNLTVRGYEFVVVMGGGNLCRGRAMQKNGVSRLAADSVGMLSTVINGLVFQDYLKQSNVSSRVYSAFATGTMAPAFDVHTAKQDLRTGHVVICVGGTGNPLCSTDSAASLRAIQLDVDLFVKLSNVKGVYDKDPNKHKDAVLFKTIGYDEYLHRGLKVMDLEACRQCKMFGIPIRVADCRDLSVLEDLVIGKEHGTLIGDE